MKEVFRACKKCKRITVEKVCPVHGEEKTTTDWMGFIYIVEPKVSSIADRAGTDMPGMYAIKVRQ